MRELDAAMESPRFGMEVSSNGLGWWACYPKMAEIQFTCIYTSVCFAYYFFQKCLLNVALRFFFFLNTFILDKI
jgi:hypothetical protein